MPFNIFQSTPAIRSMSMVERSFDVLALKHKEDSKRSKSVRKLRVRGPLPIV